jgi:hypothetical protein
MAASEAESKLPEKAAPMTAAPGLGVDVFMTENPETMADMVAILEARRADYMPARAEIDTSGDTIERSFAKRIRVVQSCLEPDAQSRSAKVQSSGGKQQQ